MIIIWIICLIALGATIDYFLFTKPYIEEPIYYKGIKISALRDEELLKILGSDEPIYIIEEVNREILRRRIKSQ